MNRLILLFLIGLTSIASFAQAQGSENNSSLAIKGKLLLADDFKFPVEYTKEFQALQDGWKVRAWHATWKRTAEGVESIWETGHNPVLAYECSLQNAIVELDFRFSSKANPENNAYCRVNLTNRELDPKAYSVSTWINATSRNRPRGILLEHEEWKPGGNTPVNTLLTNNFKPDTWYSIRLEVMGDYARLSCNGITVLGSFEKFALEKKLLVIGVGKSSHELRRLRVYEAIPNPAWAKPKPQEYVSISNFPARSPMDTSVIRKISQMTPIFDGKTLNGWIQEPVAPTTLVREDVLDQAGFIRLLNERADPVSAFLNENLDSAGRAGLAAAVSGNTNPRQTLSPILKSINLLLKSDDFYNPVRFGGVSLRPQTRQLLLKKPREYELARLNRLLIEDAYPKELAKSPETSWMVKDGSLVSTGAGRGVIYTEKDFENYRLVFQVRQKSGNHYAGVLLFCQRPPVGQPGLDALGGIQFAVPSGGHWDYRPGFNRSGDHFRRPFRIRFDEKEWAQVEILVNAKSGTARMAVAQPVGTRSLELLYFKDPAAGKSGPIALQMHNALLFDEYRDIRIEINPKEEKLITLD